MHVFLHHHTIAAPAALGTGAWTCRTLLRSNVQSRTSARGLSITSWRFNHCSITCNV